MQSRSQPIDLCRGNYFITATGKLVSVYRVGVDLHGEPLFSGGPGIYARNGDIVSVQGRDKALQADDLVSDFFALSDPEVSTEAAMEVALALVEDHILAALAAQPSGVQLTPYLLGEAVDEFLTEHPRFRRFRQTLIRSGWIWVGNT